MNQVVNLLARIAALEGRLNQSLNQVSPIQIATVTDNDDPTGQRRIRVTREIQAGQSQSYWLQCGRSTTFTDEPLPSIGSTVLIACVDGNPHDVYYLRTLANDTNPPDGRQENPIADHTVEVPGDERHSTGGNFTQRIEKNQSIDVSGNISIESSGGKFDVRSDMGSLTMSASDTVIIKNDAGASLTLFKNGAILFQDSAGRKIYLGGAANNSCYWDLNSTAINIINAIDFKVNGLSIATVGAIDSRGDSLVSRGW
jgi:uncharacterized protein involved in type VI secretion and phage assembly